MLNDIDNFGSDSPESLMERFYKTGNKNLLALRNYVTNPEKRKKPRTWSSIESAKLVGVSNPTFRKLVNRLLEENPNASGIVTLNSKSKRFDLNIINKLRDLAHTRYKRPNNSEPIILAVSNFKGGVGKTQTAVDLSKKIAIEGMKVLLLDFDAQATATLISSGIIPDLELEYEDTITDTLLKDPNLITNIIRSTHFDGLDIVPANLAIQDAELLLQNNEKNNFDELGSVLHRLSNALNIVKDNYDVIIVDCGPNLGMLTLNSIMACNGILIPIPPSMSDYSSFVMYTATLRQLFGSFPDKKLEFLRIVLTKHNGSKEALSIENMMRSQFGSYVLTNSMCETVEVAKATNDIGTIYDTTKPRGSKEAYRRALQHLNDLNMEIINSFKEIWQKQSLDSSNKESKNVRKEKECA